MNWKILNVLVFVIAKYTENYENAISVLSSIFCPKKCYLEKAIQTSSLFLM